MLEDPASKSVSLETLHLLSFPTYFTASYNYFATGEGHSMAVLMGYANNAAELGAKIEEAFNPYFSQGATIWPDLRVPEEAEALVPDIVRILAADTSRMVGKFHYFSLFHLNQS